MDFFQKPRVLTTVIILLLVLNFGTLAFLWFSRPHKPRMFINDIRHPEPREFLMQQLNFNDTQKDELKKLRKEHMDAVRTIQDSIAVLKDQLFDQLAVIPTDTPKVSALIQAIGEQQKKIEFAAFFHFQKVRALCDDNQKKQFDKIMKDVVKMIEVNPPGPMMRDKMHKHDVPDEPPDLPPQDD